MSIEVKTDTLDPKHPTVAVHVGFNRVHLTVVETRQLITKLSNAVQEVERLQFKPRDISKERL